MRALVNNPDGHKNENYVVYNFKLYRKALSVYSDITTVCMPSEESCLCVKRACNNLANN